MDTEITPTQLAIEYLRRDKSNLSPAQYLKKLKQLLRTIIRKWPDVEFLTTDKLGDLIVNDDNSGLYRATRS